MRLIGLFCSLALLMALGCSEESDPKGADPCFSQCEASVLTVECGTDEAGDCDTGNRCYTSARGAICIAENSSDGDAETEMDRRIEVSDCYRSCAAAGNGGSGGSAGAGGVGGGAGVGGGGPVELEEHIRLSYTKTTLNVFENLGYFARSRFNTTGKTSLKIKPWIDSIRPNIGAHTQNPTPF